MITPTINPNGSSIDDLIAPRVDAVLYLKSAIEALRQVWPNGRDYPGDADSCTADRDEHYSRIEVLRTMLEQIANEAVYIKEQGQ